MRSLLRKAGGLRRLILLTICGVCAVLFMNSVLQSSTRQISYEVDNLAEHGHKHAPNRTVHTHQSYQHVDSIKPPFVDAQFARPLPPSDERLPLKAKTSANVVHIKRTNVAFGDSLSLCGLRDVCNDDQIPMYFYSGKNKDDEPKICIDGRFVVGKNLNAAGRGLNIVIIYPPTKEVVRVGHFDTYAEDSSTLEIFLEQVQPTEMIAIVSFDEAASRLSSLAKQLFYDLGSGLVQNMKFRASWFFVGQKGISGFTPFEQLNYANNNEWAKPIDIRMCVPKTLDGQKTHADPLPNVSNDQKRAFCKKYDGYEDFCDDAHIDDALTPAPSLIRDQPWEITKVPMLIVAGLSHNAMRLCLETVLRQPGIHLEKVLITYDENYNEVEALATLFGFNSKAINASSSYMAQYEKALQTAWNFYPDANELIVVEEEIYLTIDFTHFLDQMLPILRQDPKMPMVAAWNDNGFDGAASNAEYAYRINDGSVPAMGYMMTRSFYNDRMRKNFKECCNSRVWEEQWKNLLQDGESIIVPEVPRVVRRRFDGLGSNPTLVKDMFSRSRTFVRSIDNNITAVMQNYGTDDLYRKYLTVILSTAMTLERLALEACFTEDASPPTLPGALNTGQAIVIYIKERAWPKMQKCFGAYYTKGADRARGLFDHILRLSYDRHSLLIVSEKSSFFEMRPSEYQPIDV